MYCVNIQTKCELSSNRKAQPLFDQRGNVCGSYLFIGPSGHIWPSDWKRYSFKLQRNYGGLVHVNYAIVLATAMFDDVWMSNGQCRLFWISSMTEQIISNARLP